MPTIQHESGTCKKCGGRIFRRLWSDGQARGDWLHLYEADWVDDPHHAKPAPIDYKVPPTAGDAFDLSGRRQTGDL